jgi:hypothetical protein
MTETRKEYERRRKAMREARGISAACIRGGHSTCQGLRFDTTLREKVPCQCYCHLHVCPRCKQPTMHGFRKAIHDAANALEQQAKQVRKYVECVQ